MDRGGFFTLVGPLSRQGILKRPDTGSPFIYSDVPDGQPRLDFERYCKEFNGGRAPDFITIHFIVNDSFGIMMPLSRPASTR